MEVQEQKTKPLQWHPAFYAGIQIELEAEKDNLIFENEHQLGTKPKEIDVLIVKKESEKPICKNIGKLFRKHNIIEYKSPDDYLSIDDFYKVYGYACFYKADTSKADVIKIEDITISLVCRTCPRLLVQHLRKVRGFIITRVDKGIYYITGDKIPIQMILTKELSKEENLWLGSLTNDLQSQEIVAELLREYGNHKDDNLYKSMMNIIVRANKDTFQEVKTMCEALEELMKDELDAREKKGREEGVQALIQDNLEEKKSREEIIGKLMKLFSLDEDEAGKYYNKFAK